MTDPRSIEEVDPRIKTGYEFEIEGIRRLVVFPEISLAPQVRIYPGEGQINFMDGCVGNTYYTSLPAKCRSLDGRLVRVGGVDSNSCLYSLRWSLLIRFGVTTVTTTS